jgi:hypothetical protein
MAAVSTIVLAGAAVVSAGVGVVGAIESRKAAKKKAALANDETRELFRLKENEIQGFQQDQTAAFAKSGVLLEGTPLEVLEATRQEGNRQQDAILRTGKAQVSLANAQGRTAILQGIGAVAGGAAGVAGAVAGGTR